MSILISGCLNGSNDTKPPVLSNMTLEEQNDSEHLRPYEPVAIYSVEQEEYESFLDSYEKKLLEKGWKVVLDNQPDFLSVEKEDTVLKVMPIKMNNGIEVQLFEEIKEKE